MSEPFSMIDLPAARTREKPRRRGRTMMMDWGLPLGAQADWLGLVAPYVDLAKLVVGTARLYDEGYLREKLARYREHAVEPFLGGQFLEYVVATGGLDGVAPFAAEAARLGIGAVEVSDNVVPLDAATRRAIVDTLLGHGLAVHGEVGSKTAQTEPGVLVAQAREFLEAGADVVLVEAADLMAGGAPRADLLDVLRRDLDLARVMFELPGPWLRGVRQHEVYEMKTLLVGTFGPDVNLANVMPEHVFETEALRCGLSVPGPPG